MALPGRGRGGCRGRRRSRAGWRRSTSGGPSAMTRPSAITTTQSLMSCTTSMSCSTNITVRPSLRSSLMCSSRLCVSAGFTPAIGSSSMISRGSAISARAISSSLRWPPESDAGVLVAHVGQLEPLEQARRPASSISRSWARHRGRMSAVRHCPRPAGPWRRASCSRSRCRRRQALGELERADHAACGPPCGRGMPLESIAVETPRARCRARRSPVSRLKNVVLPAPLGPMSAVIRPRWTSTWSTSTASRPPKWRMHPVGDEDRVGLGARRALGLNRRRSATARRRQRTSKACSRRSPKMPCGRNTTSSASRVRRR